MRADPSGVFPRVAVNTHMIDDNAYKVATVLHEWNGYWRRYEELLAELRGQFGLNLRKKELKKCLKVLLNCKVIHYGTAYTDDFKFAGRGYFHMDGDPW
jgi:hypothetical protein